jgi:sulfur-carrier protein adenylyltransferase/sulfurtransferase
VEADGGLAGESPGQRAETAERMLRGVFVELPDRGRDLRLGVPWSATRSTLENPRRRDRSSDALEPDAIQKELADAPALRAPPERVELAPRRQVHDLGRRRERGNEAREAARELRVKDVPREDRVRRVGLGLDGRSPRGHGIAALGPQAGEPEMELDGCALGIELRELLDAVERAHGPGCEGRPDLCLERVVPVEESRRALEVSLRVEDTATREVARLRIVAEPEREGKRWASRPRLRVGDGGRRRVSVRGQHRPGYDRHGGGSGQRDQEDDAASCAHRATIAVRIVETGLASSQTRRCNDAVARPGDAIVRKVMAGYRELLARVKEEVEEISSPLAQELLTSDETPLVLDVREPDEWEEGHIPRAIHVPRGWLEARIEGLVPDKNRPLLVYCSGGSRSAFAAKALGEMGYEDVVNLAGGFTDWKRNGFEVSIPRVLTSDQRSRYSRHLLIPEVGEDGQQRILDARVLLVGAGGLGSPASLYLAAAGVGTLGIVDADVVDESNLQRQIIHATDRLGEPKVLSAKRTIEALNPDVRVQPYEERLTSDNVDRILGEGWDVIVDGADNFPTRYLVNDASVWRGIPVVHGSIFRFEGQVTVFAPGAGPCYRCLFLQPPPPELAPSCAEGGVLGVLPGIIGSLQANETLKLILDRGDTLAGRLLLFDALGTTLDEVTVRRDPYCPVCGDNPTITEYVDYVEFCNAPVGRS